MIHQAARFFSIAGHPAVVMPIAAVVAAADAGPAVAAAVFALACGAGLLVLGYGYHKTRRGDWGHMDASATGERAELNTRAASGLAIIAAVLAFAATPLALVAAVALSSLLLLAAHLLRRVTKLSLHQAFAVFAALVAWPHHLATGVLLLISIGVGWSRLALGRHVGRDLAWGAALGLLAGLAFQAA